MRARAIVIVDGHIAMMKRVKKGRTFYVFPGGIVEDGERPEETAVRETLEEMCLVITIDGHFGDFLQKKKHQRLFFATYMSGQMALGNGEEFTDETSGTYEPVWFPLTDLLRVDVRPAAAARLLYEKMLKKMDNSATL